MARTPGFPQLEASLGALQDLRVVPSVGQVMRVGTRVIHRNLFESILNEVSAYTDSGNPDVLPELRAHLDQHIDATCRLLGGEDAENFEFVRRHAQRRAEQKFPLDALLHAYRVIHKLFSRWIRDAALESAPESAHVRRVVAAVTDFTIEYTGAIGTLVTSEYVTHTRLLAEAEGDRRTELLSMLLSGYDESDNRAARLLRSSGYLAQRQSFCVAVARSVNPEEMESTARAQRMADAITEALRETPCAVAGRYSRESRDCGDIGHAQAVGLDGAAVGNCRSRVVPALRMVGPAALIGLSSDAPSTSHIPRALREARVALEFASVSDRVKRYAEIPLQQMLVQRRP